MSAIATYTCKCGWEYTFDEDDPNEKIVCTNPNCDQCGRVSIPVRKTKPFDCQVCGKTMIIPQSLYKVGGTAVCPVCHTLYRVGQHKVILNVAAEDGQLVPVRPPADIYRSVKCPFGNHNLTITTIEAKDGVKLTCPTCNNVIKLGPHGYRYTQDAEGHDILTPYYQDRWTLPKKIVKNGVTYYKLAFSNQLINTASYVSAIGWNPDCPVDDVGHPQFFEDPATTFASLNLPAYTGSEPSDVQEYSCSVGKSKTVWYTTAPWDSEFASLAKGTHFTVTTTSSSFTYHINLELRDGMTSCPIDWGDGAVGVGHAGAVSHIFPANRTCNVRIGDEAKHFAPSLPATMNPHVTAFTRMGDHLESLRDTFSYASITSVPAWGPNITSAYGAFAVCGSLTSIPETFPPNLRDMSACFMRCSSLTGTMPKWPECFYEFTESNPPTTAEEIARWNLTSANSTYYQCQLSEIWDNAATDAEKMPYIKTHTYTVSYCPSAIRSLFKTTWGGTRTS